MLKLIELMNVEREYGFVGTLAIIERDNNDRLLIVDAYGGESTLSGGAVRWRHGYACKLNKSDTLSSLQQPYYNDGSSILSVASNGYDSARPIMPISGRQIATLAAELDI